MKLSLAQTCETPAPEFIVYYPYICHFTILHMAEEGCEQDIGKTANLWIGPRDKSVAALSRAQLTSSNKSPGHINKIYRLSLSSGSREMVDYAIYTVTVCTAAENPNTLTLRGIVRVVR